MKRLHKKYYQECHYAEGDERIKQAAKLAKEYWTADVNYSRLRETILP